MTDNSNFEKFVQAQELDAERLYQSARSYLAERFDYPESDELLQKLAVEVPPAADLCTQLANDGLLLEDAALCVLDAAWRDPAERPQLRRAVATASTKLPVVDPALIAPLVLYGLHVLLRNTRRSEKTVVRGRDGKTRTTELEETGALAVLLGELQRWRSGRDR